MSVPIKINNAAYLYFTGSFDNASGTASLFISGTGNVSSGAMPLFLQAKEKHSCEKETVDRLLDYLKGKNNHEAVAIKCNDVIYPTIRAMCQQEQINLSTFKYWRKNNQLAKHGIEIL